MKGIYKRIIIITLLAAACAAFTIYLKTSSEHVASYVTHVFLPYQRFRDSIFNKTSISIGDYIYLLLSFLLLVLIVRWVYYAVTFKRNKIYFFTTILQICIFCISIYLCFLISWGGNYYRPALTTQWKGANEMTWDTSSLVQLNKFLVIQLNAMEKSPINYPKIKYLNEETNHYFHSIFSDKLPSLKIKRTTIGYLLNYAGVHGYYNPISGEGQFNKGLPNFMHPFVVSHEMAHQAGIAAEDEANFVAYIVGIKSGNRAFQYSAYFNIFLYSFSDLKMRDTASAREVWNSLNQKSKDDYISLLNMYFRYRSFVRGFSNDLYDYYLKWNGQNKGLESYNVVVRWVYYWEFIAKEKADLKICPSS